MSLPETKDAFWLPKDWRVYLDPPDPRGLTRRIVRFNEQLYGNTSSRYDQQRAWEVANELTGFHDADGVWHPPKPPDARPPVQQHIPLSVRDGSWQQL